MPRLMEVRFNWNVLEQWDGKKWQRVCHIPPGNQEPKPEVPGGSSSRRKKE